MIDALNFILVTLSTLLAIAILTWLLLWVYRNFLQPEMAAATPAAVTAAVTAAESIAETLATAAKTPDRIDDGVLSDTYTQLIALAEITANLYQRYNQATDEARRLNRLMKHFSEDGNKVTLTNSVQFIAGCQGINDLALTALIANEDALVIPAYVGKVYLSLAKAAELSNKTAQNYRQTAEQLFREVETIRRRVAEIRTHIRSHNAARLVADINRELDKTSKLLKIDGEHKTISDYVEGWQ